MGRIPANLAADEAVESADYVRTASFLSTKRSAFRIKLFYRWGCKELYRLRVQVPGLHEAFVASQPERHSPLPST
jgi:hypothetical protein